MIFKNAKQIQEKTIQEDLMVSVIIRNRNEGEFIGFAIQSVIDYLPDAEIIIVDNNSTDDSLEVVNMFEYRIPIKTIKINNYSPGRALNLGVKEAKGDVILILSAHSQIVECPTNVIPYLFTEFVAIFGKQIPIYRGKKITPRYIWSHFENEPSTNMFSDIEDRQFLHNAFCFYSKQFLLNNPFNEVLSGKEDRYWAEDVVKKGYKYYYDPNLVVNHYYTKNGATWKGIG
jgi:rhamnosyltransferase